MARTDYGAILSTVIKDTSDSIREVNGTVGLIAPNQWGANIRTMKSASDYDNALAQMIEETASGAIAHFTDGANAIPVKSLIANITATQSGTGDPSPTNVRTISGWSGCNVSVGGDNLFDKSASGIITGYYLNTYGSEQQASGWLISEYIPVNENCIYRAIGLSTAGQNTYCIVYDENKTMTSKVLIVANQDTNIPTTTGDKYVRLSVRTLSSEQNTAKFYGSTTATIPFGQTVCGGTLDVTTGELTVTHGIVDLGTLTWGKWTYNNSFYAQIAQAKNGQSNEICSNYKTSASGSQTSLTNGSCCFNAGQAFYIKDDRYEQSTIVEFKSAMNGVMLVYELATPTTVTLTPEEVTTLLGDNNIFADTGDVEVVYRANGQLYVAQHT